MKTKSAMCLLIFVIVAACTNKGAIEKTITGNLAVVNPQTVLLKKNDAKVIHVFTALCDNKYQGIVPVPVKIGNGQDPQNNLYWGAAYGVKSFFKKQLYWKLVEELQNEQPNSIMERCVFKHSTENVYLIADAYDGREIKQCTVNFLKSCSGAFADSVVISNKTIYCGGSSDIVAYTGHDGLMDFDIKETYPPADSNKKEAIILACYSKKYFAPHLKATGATPLLWTTGLCSPEAYTLDAAIQSRIKKETPQMAQQKAAQAYSKYQKCSVKAAGNLMVTGW
jgi:hypothetical protein